MRILTVISGMLLAIAGAFTFAFYTNAFTGLAFILGLVMLISGLCVLGAYIISGKVGRLPDTVLVEGMVTTLFGFAVLNNEVMDAMVTLFFGTWMTLSGVTRISQGFAVSRYRPRDWAKIMPLALAGTILGVIMLMPSLTSYMNPMFLVGAAFIVNGFSQLVYSMYMRRHELTDREIEAQERAEARKTAKEAERKERNANRSTSWHEREEQREEQRKEEKRRQAELRAAKMRELQEKRAARRPASEATMEFTPQEAEEINRLADAPAREPVSEPAPEPVQEPAPEVFEDEAPVTEVLKPKTAPVQEEDILQKAKAPVWMPPENIPSLRAKKLEEEAVAAPQPAPAEEPADVLAKRAAVNIEKIEEGLDNVEFEPVELPDVELESTGGEAKEREEIIEKLETEVRKDDPFKPFEALKLEDLFGDDYVPLRDKDPKEATRFTQSLNLDWTKH